MRERDHMATRGTRQGERATARRSAIDLVMFIAIGVLMGFLGPFGTAGSPVVERYAYWMICMVGGGLIGIATDDLLSRRMAHGWRRVLLASVLMTPPVALLVLAAGGLLMDERFSWFSYGCLFWQVWPVSLAVTIVRALVWRPAPTRIETRTVIAPPLPEAEAAFRRRLSARRRTARLIAIEAHDHYLKIHTDAGQELISLRLSDALEELAQAHGWRIHRSWWVAADAIESVRWRRGGGEARLAGGLTAPVSRTFAPVLKQAGWF